MKVVTLVENTACQPEFGCEHGLSLYIETADHKILFDAGQTGLFADNAQRLGIDLGQVDIAVLSHGHFDHGGGLHRFLELNKTAPVYLREGAFLSHGNAQNMDIGLDPALQGSDRLVFTEDELELAPGIRLCSCNREPRPYGTDSAGITEDGKPDLFNHEQYLLIEEAGKRICFSGCSHKGILNIMQWFRPDVLFGGFHFMRMELDDPRLAAAAETLMGYPTTYYTGHCTGQTQYDFLKSRMGDKLHPLPTGTRIEL